MEKMKKLFSEFKIPDTFRRFDSDHLLDFYIGIDDMSRKSLVLRTCVLPPKVISTSSIDVIVGKSKVNEWNIGFHLKNNEMSGLFYRFCEDIIESTRNIEDNILGVDFVIKRFNQWKKMFFKPHNNLLSEQEVMGLIGELIFLKDFMIHNYDLTNCIDSWGGPDYLHKDFSINSKWYEVKSIQSGALTVRISSVEQLDDPINGELVVVELEKMSEIFDGIKLNDLIANIRDFLNNVELQDKFINKLKTIGYFYDDEYDKYCYRLIRITRYQVNDEFPIIKREGLHLAIVRVQYDLMLNQIVVFKI